MSKSLKSHLRGVVTVDAPKRRLRMWVGLPILVGAGVASLPLRAKLKELVAADRPYVGALVGNAVPLAVGAVLTANP